MKNSLVFCILLCLSIRDSYAQFTKLLDFNGTNGSTPFGSLTISGNDSILYGMTASGGADNAGVIFSINTNGSHYTFLRNFTRTDTSGSSPHGSLILSGNILYGMTSENGIYGYGNIFSIHTNGSEYKDLYDFQSLSDGGVSDGSLIISVDTLYGMTFGQGIGAGGKGTVFSILTDGSGFKTLLEFNDTNGERPMGDLILSGNVLYGMTSGGGANGNGIIFSIYTNGKGYKDLLDFNKANGSVPEGSLTLAGNVLYGVTNQGGSFQEGLVFSIHTDGSTYKDILDFSGANGHGPGGSLILAGSTLYGTTELGGTNNYGTVFSIDTNGTGYKDIFNFNSSDGKQPFCSLTLSGSSLFGTAVNGGAYGDGVLFSYSGITGIDQLTALANVDINIFPNPASYKLQYTISTIESSQAKLVILDILGRTMSTETIQLAGGKNSFFKNISDFNNGVYFLQVSTPSGHSIQKKFIVIQH